jgi:hypothetical protein
MKKTHRASQRQTDTKGKTHRAEPGDAHAEASRRGQPAPEDNEALEGGLSGIRLRGDYHKVG